MENISFQQERFLPFIDDWITIQIYSGSTYLDKLLSQLRNPILELIEEGIVISFFFIRYRDPDPHLRLRFKIKNSLNIKTVFDSLYNVFREPIKLKVIWKIKFDGYDRELFRYSYVAISLVEEIFHHCSVFILSKLHIYENRLILALSIFDLLISLLGYDLYEKYAFCKDAKTRFMYEFDFTKNTRNVLALKFKAYEELIANSFKYIYNPDFEELKVSLSPLCEELKKLEEFGVSHRKFTIVSSLLHMNFNRIFVSDGRIKEAIIYYLLDKYYAKLVCQR